MSLLRRNKDNQSQAVPAPQTTQDPTPPKEKKSGGGIVQWLKDSYNGLYKIVLEPSMPTKATVALVVVGLILGIIWGYTLGAPVFSGANPNRLNQAAQDQWIKMASANLQRGFYDDAEAAKLINQVDNPSAAIQRLLDDPTTTQSDREVLARMQPLAATVAGTPSPQGPNFLLNLALGFIIPLVLVIVIVPIATVAWRLLIQPNFAAPIIQKIQENRDPALKAKNDKARADLKVMREQNALLQEMKKNTIDDVELGAPVTQVLKVYTKGRSYDESDEIESGDDFLGQCGSVIPEAIEPDPLAIELWLFDMFATGDQNHKKLFITEYAANDPAIRAKLTRDPDVDANEWVIAQPGAKIIIDSEKIRLQGEMIAVETSADGRFEGFRMKVSAWKKEGKNVSAPAPKPLPAMPTPSAPAPQPMPQYTPPPAPYNPPPAPSNFSPSPLPAQPQYSGLGTAPQPLQPLAPPPSPLGARPLSAYDDIQFDPPPAPVQPRPISSGFGGSPLPTYNPPPPPEDDPFGSTGEFTPIPKK